MTWEINEKKTIQLLLQVVVISSFPHVIDSCHKLCDVAY